MPQNQAAWLTQAKSPLEIQSAPYNEPGTHEIVIKNHAVAINPVDWQMQDEGILIEQYPTVFGCDVAGTVEAIGSAVDLFQVGDRVIGNAVCLTLGIKYAAFQVYVLCPENVACKLPDAVSFEDGVVLPLAVNTAALGLFGDKNMNLPLPSITPKQSDDVLVVYGGSTSVGGTAIQLGKAAGVTVVATASQGNHEYCYALGADFMFDYKDKDWVSQAASHLRGKHVVGIYDSISKPATLDMLQSLKSQLGSSALVVTTRPPPEGVAANMVFGAAMPQDDQLAKHIWADFLPRALTEGKIVPSPKASVIGKGLQKIQAGLDEQRKGVNAAKIVVSVL